MSTKYAYRLPPCPLYDTETTAGWLEDMAAGGLRLSSDGFFAGLVIFERTEPAVCRYRVDALPEKRSFFGTSTEESAAEAAAISEAFGWELVTCRGSFAIYRTEDPEARELHTDPAIRALALKAVQRRAASAVLSAFLWGVLYPLVLLRGTLLLPLAMGGGWILLPALLLTLTGVGTSLAQFLHLQRLRRRLMAGEPPGRRPWQPGALRYRAGRVLEPCLIVLLIVLLLVRWNSEVLELDRQPLSAAPDPLPFATMADFAPGGRYAPDAWADSLSNYVEITGGVLCPRVIHWDEYATLTLADGRTLSGGLAVDSYEAAAPWIARQLMREYRAMAFFRRLEKMALPVLPVEDAFGYREITHFPTAALRQGRHLIVVTFYQTGEDALSPEEWMEIMAESIR